MIQVVYEEVKTPCKYDIVIEPAEGEIINGPPVFHKYGKRYRVHFPLEINPKNTQHT